MCMHHLSCVKILICRRLLYVINRYISHMSDKYDHINSSTRVTFYVLKGEYIIFLDQVAELNCST